MSILFVLVVQLSIALLLAGIGVAIIQKSRRKSAIEYKAEGKQSPLKYGVLFILFAIVVLLPAGTVKTTTYTEADGYCLPLLAMRQKAELHKEPGNYTSCVKCTSYFGMEEWHFYVYEGNPPTAKPSTPTAPNKGVDYDFDT